jgi:hypothetical protein
VRRPTMGRRDAPQSVKRRTLCRFPTQRVLVGRASEEERCLAERKSTQASGILAVIQVATAALVQYWYISTMSEGDKSRG